MTDRKPASSPIVPKGSELPIVQNPAMPDADPDDQVIHVQAEVVDHPPSQPCPHAQDLGTMERIVDKVIDGMIEVQRISADQQRQATEQHTRLQIETTKELTDLGKHSVSKHTEQHNVTVKSTTARPPSVTIKLINRAAEFVKRLLELFRRDQGVRDRNVPNKHNDQGDK